MEMGHQCADCGRYQHSTKRASLVMHRNGVRVIRAREVVVYQCADCRRTIGKAA